MRHTLILLATIPSSLSIIANIALRPNYNFVDTVRQNEEHNHLHVEQLCMVLSQEVFIGYLFSILERETNTLTYKIIVFFVT